MRSRSWRHRFKAVNAARPSILMTGMHPLTIRSTGQRAPSPKTSRGHLPVRGSLLARGVR